MGFDDLYEHQSSHRNDSHYDESAHYDNKRNYNRHHSHHGSAMPNYLNYFLGKVKNNRRLKIWIGILFIIFLAIVIVLAVILVPLIVKLVNFISQNGIQGVVDNISVFLDKIWKGNGK